MVLFAVKKLQQVFGFFSKSVEKLFKFVCKLRGKRKIAVYLIHCNEFKHFRLYPKPTDRYMQVWLMICVKYPGNLVLVLCLVAQPLTNHKVNKLTYVLP
jgi:hypothetical protein